MNRRGETSCPVRRVTEGGVREREQPEAPTRAAPDRSEGVVLGLDSNDDHAFMRSELHTENDVWG